MLTPDGNELPDCERATADSDSADKPPAKRGNTLCDLLPFAERWAECCTPRTVDEAEHQQSLRKPQRTIAKHLVVPKPREGGPEAAAFGGIDHRIRQRSQNEPEHKQRQAKAKEAVRNEASVALAFERGRSEVPSK